MAISEFDKGQRYFPDTLRHGNADIKHFVPVNGLEDRFGNRIFRSTDLVYTDRSYATVRAALLVSRSGRDFITENPRILRDIDRGLVSVQSGQPVTLSEDRQLERWKGGSQSSVNLLTVGDRQFVVKTQASRLYSQPFVNEMLQVQSLEADLHDQLNQRGVRMPTSFFASGQVSCMEFVKGTEATEDDLAPIVGGLYRVVKNYVDGQNKAGNKLWRGVFLDLMKFYPVSQIRTNNFIKQEDGQLAWIDPFFFR